ncbi:N-acetylglucosamine-6-phosphate deacetylase [Pseudanabaena galeata UHCC 0370]|uniref:N-acetylglucosamine-6-phosphate deacetylase n=1 Tax=Pseudanabaena galeata UHCC 0370 TaxID=3110310 RepID=A0ABU5TN34_9CYAN|nr:N-acetylglucosamine-6-phosphate deacetylase [Pseudanabaena galeata]MEA5479436.1 N-acetylglucosamine-6-phosphate deacetylase [Pseudanabaena galeata UHCC 0370]
MTGLRRIICSTQGAIDLQINGALGIPFNDLNRDRAAKLPEICRFLYQQGLDGFLPTLVTADLEQFHRSLFFLSEAIAYQKQHLDPQEAKILGVHLEGPFLHPDKRGAHPQQHLLTLNLDTLRQVLGDYTNIIKLVTLAPELDPSGETIQYLRDRHIIVSLGHSTANAEQTRTAIAQGATMVTHAFNAMSSLHHRDVGLLGEAILSDHVWCGLIADGVHVSPEMLKLLYRMKKQIFLVSDALAPLGLPDGTYPWDDRQITIKNGTARLPDGTLSGTTLPLINAVNNLVQWNVCTELQAIDLAINMPRHAMNLAIDPDAPARLTWTQVTYSCASSIPIPNYEPVRSYLGCEVN